MDNLIKWFEEKFFRRGCEMIKEGVLPRQAMWCF